MLEKKIIIPDISFGRIQILSLWAGSLSGFTKKIATGQSEPGFDTLLKHYIKFTDISKAVWSKSNIILSQKSKYEKRASGKIKVMSKNRQ